MKMALKPIGLPTLAHFVLAAAMCFWAQFALAAVPIETYGALPSVDNLIISPSGKSLAFRQTSKNEDLILVLSSSNYKVKNKIDLKNDFDGVYGKAFIPNHLIFIDDERLILQFKSDFEFYDKSIRHTWSKAYVCHLGKHTCKRLQKTSKRVYWGQVSLGHIVGVSPDKEHVYMSAYAGDADIIESPSYYTFRVKLDSPSYFKAQSPGNRYSENFFMGTGGNVFVHEIFDDYNNSHSLRVNNEGSWKTIYSEETDIKHKLFWGLSEDRNFLFFSENTEKSQFRSLYKLSLNNGTISKSRLSSDAKDIDKVITDINQVVIGVKYAGFHPSYAFEDKKLTQRVGQLLKQFEGNSVHIPSWTSDWKTLVLFVEGSDFPGVYFTQTGKDTAFKISSSYNGIQAEDLHPIAKWGFKARDGLRIPVLLTIPKSKVTTMKNLPAVIIPHGGTSSYDQIGFDWTAQAFASQGYLVVQPQYRGSAGFGYQHLHAGIGEWGRGIQDDINETVSALSSKGYIDKNKVCVVGGDFGGFVALSLGAFSPDVFKCIVAVNGFSDLNLLRAYSPYSLGRTHRSISHLDHFIGEEALSKKALSKISPINHADKFKAPVLLIHGLNIVKHSKGMSLKQSKRMHKKLRRAKKQTKFIEYKDDSHHPLSPTNKREKALGEMVDFVNKSLQSL